MFENKDSADSYFYGTFESYDSNEEIKTYTWQRSLEPKQVFMIEIFIKNRYSFVSYWKGDWMHLLENYQDLLKGGRGVLLGYFLIII